MLGHGRLRDPPRRRRAHVDRGRRVPRRDPVVGWCSATESAIRISTGGAIPDGATAVIPQEDVEARDGTIITRTVVERRRSHPRRRRGHARRRDRASGRRDARRRGAGRGGRRRRGRADRLPRPRVQVLCTGDELRAPGEPLGPGEIHNSNAPMLDALAEARGRDRGTARRLRDDPAATEAGLAAALDERRRRDRDRRGVGRPARSRQARARRARRRGGLLARGAPARQADLVRHARGRCSCSGCPGNPVSAVVTFSLFVRPALAALQGAKAEPMLETEAVLATAVRRNPDREQAVRVRLERRGRHARRHAQRPAGVAHRDLAARRGRARVRPGRRGRVGGRRGRGARAAFPR